MNAVLVSEAFRYCLYQYKNLELDVQTDMGNEKFTLLWTQSQAIDFGKSGKLLIDSEENRYVVTDVERLPKADREKFLPYIYW